MNEPKSKCTKRQCLWIGKDPEKTKKALDWEGIEGSVLCCPKCGNDEFYVIPLDKQFTEKSAKEIKKGDFIKPKENSRNWKQVLSILKQENSVYLFLNGGCEFAFGLNNKIKVADFPESINQ